MLRYANAARTAMVILLIIAAALTISSKTTWAANRERKPDGPSFTHLVRKLKRTTDRFIVLIIGKRSDRQKQKNSPVTAVTKSETGEKPVRPTPAAPPSAAPRISVSASGPFNAEIPGAGQAAFGPNSTVAMAYTDGTYFVIQNDKVTATSDKPIRFSPAGAVSFLSLPDYTDLNWNQTTNLNAFRGHIEVVFSSRSKKLTAVNELGLEDYLRGIAEASHDSPEEHLKVMAIVSRSYAVHHLSHGGRHAGEPFHLKNSRNGNGDDQVYRGYLAEQRLPRIAKAAADTVGVVVTYGGQPVITPYSSRASGRTRTPVEAGWNYNWPWVQSVPDPDTTGLPRLGHGVGLSGHGSKKRAERGDSAATILSYYFPGTSLGQVDTSGQVVRVSIYAQ